ncbi:glycosyltransferase family 2 protein [Pseudaquabacterium pictum]|uniref:Glycosyl transferase n=1 Tax=Pseudaquabacterium pictum TaxID=2315236 RepID=A0A480AUK5_9BURK|nr:glycosyltransferase family 2 protein [Rubrivivax pictus]GCL65111.1 glycosyl transferase [Rubrivivax pictus]
MTPRIWLIVLNWRNGPDTIDCLASIRDVADPAIAGVVVCDNASGDGSLELIRSWLQSSGVCLVDRTTQPAAAWPEPPTPGQQCTEGAQAWNRLPVVLVDTGGNLGFAGGNNVGIALVQRHADYDGILLLNNDAMLAPGCVSAMAMRMAERPGLGMCGATVVFDWDRSIVQAYAGARFSRWLGRAKLLGAHAGVSAQRDQGWVESQLDYILGAALMISRPCLEATGAMYDGYFLYYEEIDWAVRARRRGFGLGYAPGAVVYHKEGRTIGSSTDRSKRSLLSEYYLVRAQIRFTVRFYPWCLPTVVGLGLAKCLRSVIDRDVRRALVRLRAMFGLAWQP